MAPIAIKVENLSKRYHIGIREQAHENISSALIDLFARPIRNFRKIKNLYSVSDDKQDTDDIIWAVRDVSFKINQGEVVGIIGRNGAGKTTLLRLLCGITDPTGGRAELYGRVGALLAVGTGFHKDLTGRENIYLNGTILGMRKLEIDRKLDEIVDFSGVEKFIDTPVKRYSSGMLVRLGFSVAAYLDPEILMIDEVLAVGDAAFQQKCLGKIGEVANEGRTVLFVSHNMESIAGLCQRTIYIDEGRVLADGPTDEVIHNYLTSTYKVIDTTPLAERQDRIGEGHIRFTGFHIRNKQGTTIPVIVCGEDVQFVFTYTSQLDSVNNLNIWFWINDNRGKKLILLYNKLKNNILTDLPPQGNLTCMVPHFPLRPGLYTIDINAQVNQQNADHVHDAAKIEVVHGDFYGTGRPIHKKGLFLCDHSWNLEA